MGQYFKTVNIDKRQYLNPHKFGAGLKLMEFSGQGDAIGQALLILLAHSNGRGGGDLDVHDAKLTKAEKELVGSWAGDRIVVAGDYDDPWLFVPEELRGKEFQSMEYVRGGPSNAPPKLVTSKFGERPKNDGSGEFYGETLYSACDAGFFEDISDKIITVVAKGDAPYHPWACMDLTNDGWRRCPESGVLPETEPKKPAGGKAVYAKYKAHAVTAEENIVNSLHYIIRQNPEKRATIMALLEKELAKV